MDWVYVVTKKSILNLAKIGFTTNHPTTRAIELSNLCAPHSYIVEYAVSVDNPRELKKSLHKYFLLNLIYVKEKNGLHFPLDGDSHSPLELQHLYCRMESPDSSWRLIKRKIILSGS